MTFDDGKLQEHFDRVVKIMTGLPEDLRPICALMDAYSRFKLTQGEDTPRVKEVVRWLTSAELRPALRRWYQHSGEKINPAALEFHRSLELAIEEELPFRPDDNS